MPSFCITRCDLVFVRSGERDDLVEAERAEAEVEARACRLGRVAPSPVLAAQPPADLDTVAEPRHREPGEADRSLAVEVDAPQAEAVLVESLTRCGS